MEVIDFKEFKVAIDPETNFWAIFDEFSDEIMRVYSDVNESLKESMMRYRFEVDLKTVYFNPTERCNANCPYCYIPERIKKRGRSMSYEQIEDILINLEDLGVEWVIFHGAEPLLVKDKIFRAIEEFDFNFGIQTNGFLLNEDDIDFIKENGVNIGVSFDSPDRKVEDFLRGKGHFDKVTEIIEMLSGYKNFNVITTITKYNYKHLKNLIEFLVGKVEVVLMNPVRGTSYAARNLRAEARDAASEFIKAVERSIEHTKDGERIVIGDFANIILGIVAPTSRVLQCDISPCGAGRRFFSISVDGIFPCSEFIGLEEFKISLDRLRNVRNEFSEVRGRIVEKIDDCRDCPFRNICGSPCPAEVYAEKGCLLEKSPYCEFYKRVIEHAFRVIARGDVDKVVRLDRMKCSYFVEN